MLRITFFSFFLLLSFSLIGQESASPKIKIALLGTVHFTPSTSDMYANKELEVFGEKRQKEIQKVIDKILDFKPNQICVEYPVTSQKKLDSLYQQYLEGVYKLEDDEIDQLGLKSAKQLKLEKLTCVNYYGQFDADTVMQYAMSHGQSAIAEKIGEYGSQIMGKINTRLEENTISEFLLYINSQEMLNKNAQFYSKYLMSIGKGEEYIGTELVADWYSTNLHIYTNIIRQISPGDTTILVMFGQGHIPILTHLFETNQDFEVIPIEELLD